MIKRNYNVDLFRTLAAAEKVIAFLFPAALGVYLIYVHSLIFESILKNASVGFAKK